MTLRIDPDDAETMLVYADLLASRGDPRGELIVMQCRGDLPVEESAHIAKHQDALLGPLADATVTWHRGFARRIVARHGTDIAGMLAHPSAAYVRELALEGIWSEPAVALLALPVIDQLHRLELWLDDWLEAASVIEALAARERPQLAHLGFGTTAVDQRAKVGALYEAWDVQPLVPAANVRSLARATPALTDVELRGIYMFEGLVHPALRRLAVIGDAINGCPFTYLEGEVELPALEQLDLRLLVDEYRPAVIFPLTLGPACTPKLRDLAIRGPYMLEESGGTLLSYVGDSAVLPQLRRLALSDLHQREDGPHLATLAPRFAHLQRFHLDQVVVDSDYDRAYHDDPEDAEAFEARVRATLPNLTYDERSE